MNSKDIPYGSKDYRRLKSKEWRQANPERCRELKRNWRRRNKDKNRLIAHKLRHKNIIPYMLIGCKSRAKSKGIEFTITCSDVSLPTHCPILGIELKKNSSKQPNSPSLDRVDNTKGYIPGNVRIISARANSIKNDATIEELEAIIKYMKEHFKGE